MIKDKSFYKAIFALALPIVMQNILNLVINMLDVIMIGNLPVNTEAAISAANIASKPFFLFSVFMFGITSGACVLISQYHGRDDKKTISSIAGLAVDIGIASAILYSAAVYIFAKPILGIFSDVPEVIDLGAQYLRIVVISYIFMALSNILAGILRTVEQVRLPLLSATAGMLVNGVLNYILIFGKFGAPAYGIKGAAIATVAARIVEFSIIVSYVVFHDKKLGLTLKGLIDIHPWLIKDYIRYSLPVIINEAAWAFGITLHAVVLGRLGEVQYAAYAVAQTLEQVAMLGAFGFAVATGIVIGKTVGAGDEKYAYQIGKTMLILAIGTSLTLGALVFFSRHMVVSMFNIQEETRRYADLLIIMVTITVTFKGFNCVNIVGVIRAGGDTRTALLADFVPMFAYAIPLGALASMAFHFPIQIVYLFLYSDELTKWIYGLYRFRSKKWIRNLTRAQAA